MTEKSSISDHFGERLRKLRKDKGLSQGELAEKAGINRSYLSLVENNHSSPTIDVLERLAKGLGISIWELLSKVTRSELEYLEGEMFEFYDGLKEFLTDEEEMILVNPSEAEISILRGIRFSGDFQPDKRFYRDALLSFRRRNRSTS